MTHHLARSVVLYVSPVLNHIIYHYHTSLTYIFICNTRYIGFAVNQFIFIVIYIVLYTVSEA